MGAEEATTYTLLFAAFAATMIAKGLMATGEAAEWRRPVVALLMLAAAVLLVLGVLTGVVYFVLA